MGFESYTTSLNTESAYLFSNENCNECLGRGYVECEHNFGKPIRGKDYVRSVSYCECTLRSRKLGFSKMGQ